MGMGQNYATRTWTTGISHWFHLPGCHFGYLFVTQSHITTLVYRRIVIQIGATFLLARNRLRGAGVKIKPPGNGPEVLVIGSIYQGAILGSYF